MGGEPRYCIQCGQEIGDRATCPNAACRGLPNFYREVAGPGTTPTDLGNDSRATNRTTDWTASSAPSESGVRSTWVGQKVVELRGVTRPDERFDIFPGTTRVGASQPAKILLEVPQVSSRHAKLACIAKPAGGWRLMVVDSGSTNGTFVNDERIDRAELEEGDRVRFADLEYEIHFVERGEHRKTMQI